MDTDIKSYHGMALSAALGLLLVVGTTFPRFYGFGPGIVGVAGALYLWIKYKEKPQFIKNQIIFPAILWGLAALSITWSIAPEVSLERTLKLLAIFVPGTILLSYISALKIETVQPYLRFIPLGLFVGTMVIAYDVHFGQIIYRIGHGIATTDEFAMANYNRGSTIIILCLFPARYIMTRITKKKRAKIGLELAVCLMLISVESQSAQLAFIFSLLTYWFFPYRSSKAWYGLIGLICGLSLASPFLAQYFYDNASATLNTLPFVGQGWGYAGGRLEIWDFVSRYALQNPMLGYGIEATKTIDSFDTSQTYHQITQVLHPHNFAIQFWMEFGVIGACVISGLICYLLLLIKKLSYVHQRIVLPTFMASMPVASFGYGFWQSWWIGLLFLMIALCMIAIKLPVDQKNLKT